LEAIKIRAKARFTQERKRKAILLLVRKKTTSKSLNENSNKRQSRYDLYSAEPTDEQAQQEMFTTYAIPTLPEQERNQCDANLTEHELQKALSSLKNNKSPGIDGLCKLLTNTSGMFLVPIC